MDLVFVLRWPFEFEVPVTVLILGLIVGLSNAVLALGLVLIYKSSRVINFAHGEIGAVGAVVLALLVRDQGWPYWFAFLGALALTAGLGGLVEVTVIRRLSKAPRLILLVATLGLAQLFLVVRFIVTEAIDNRSGGYPAPFKASVTVGTYLILNTSHLMILLVVPLAAVALTAFFRFTGFGIAIRAAAENADSARLSGIPVAQVSTFVWSLAAAFSAITAFVLTPGKGLFTQQTLGPGLLMRALAAAVIARMTHLPRAFAAGIAIGIVEQVVFWNFPIGGQVELVLFLLIAGALLLQHRAGLREEEGSSWSFTQTIRPIPAHLADLPAVRVLRRVPPAIALVAVAALPFFLSNSQTFLLTTIVSFAILGLSLTILTGWTGQVSLGQVGFFGLGAAVSYQLTMQAGLPFWVALVVAGAFGSVASVAIGLPALRVRGLFLPVTTLGFALVAQQWLLGQDWMLGVGVIAGRPTASFMDLTTQRGYFFVAFVLFLVVVWLVRNLLRSGVGRNFVAIRDNELGGAAFAVSPTGTKLTAFAVAGFVAAFAGAVYGHGVQHFSIANFPVVDSLRIVSMAIIGGLGSISGTVIGVAVILGIDRLVPVAELRMLTTSLGLLLLLILMPGGFAQPLYAVRDWAVDWIARRSGGPPDAEPAPAAVPEAVELLVREPV